MIAHPEVADTRVRPNILSTSYYRITIKLVLPFVVYMYVFCRGIATRS